MVTLASSPRPGERDEPHRHREFAESFGVDAERYDRSRPGYPPAMTDAILTVLPGSSVVDVGIGTGISARPFVTAGCRVLGIEADERMVEVARQRGFEVEHARFEDWDPADLRVDAVISGQTWHWIDPVAGAANAGRALRPGGRIALFWNIFRPSTELAAAFGEVYRRVDTGLPFEPWAVDPLAGYSTILEKTTDGLRRADAFDDIDEWRFDWERDYTRAEWLDLVPTAGGHSRIPAEGLAELLAGLGAAVDAAGGRISMGYATIVITARRR